MKWPWSKCQELEGRLKVLEKEKLKRDCKHFSNIMVKYASWNQQYGLPIWYAYCLTCDTQITPEDLAERLTPKKKEETNGLRT